MEKLVDYLHVSQPDILPVTLEAFLSFCCCFLCREKEKEGAESKEKVSGETCSNIHSPISHFNVNVFTQMDGQSRESQLRSLPVCLKERGCIRSCFVCRLC